MRGSGQGALRRTDFKARARGVIREAIDKGAVARPSSHGDYSFLADA